MNNMFAAREETFILNAKGEATHLIVGWIHIQGNRVDPIFISTRGGIRRNEAIGVLLEGVQRVEHPHSGKVFNSNAAWVAFAEENAAELATVEIKAPEAAATGEVVDGPLKFGTTTNKSSAFFIWPHALGVGQHGVFEIPGETPHPNDSRVKKIKRTDMAAEKRAGAQKIDPKKWPLVGEIDGEAVSPSDYMDIANDVAEPEAKPTAAPTVEIDYNDL